MTRYAKNRLGRLDKPPGDNDAEPEIISFVAAVRRLLANAIHCLPRSNDLIWATCQRSGFYWFRYMYTIVLMQWFFNESIDLSEIEVFQHRFYRYPVIRYDFREDLREAFRYDLQIPRLLHTHGYYRSWMKYRPILLQVRNPKDILISKFFFNQYHLRGSFGEFLESEGASYVVEFFDSWSRIVETPKEVFVLRFESLKEAPEEQLKAVFSFLGLPDVPEHLFHEAVKKTTLSKIRAHHEQKRRDGSTKMLTHGRSGKVGQEKDLKARDRVLLELFVRTNFESSLGADGGWG